MKTKEKVVGKTEQIMLSTKRKPEQNNENVGVGNDQATLPPPLAHFAQIKRHRNMEPEQTFVNTNPALNAEDCSFVTVETCVCDEKGANLIHHSQINLLSHCVFCLRKTTSKTRDYPSSSPSPSVFQEDLNSTELSKDVPRAYMSDSSSSPQLLSTFNSVWRYLGRRKQSQQFNEDPLHLLEEPDAKARRTCLDLPNMCVFCAKKVEDVHKLFIQLTTQLNAIGKIMEESKYGGKYSWRAEQFERVLTNTSLEQDVIAATINVLIGVGELGRNTINEPNYGGGPHEDFSLTSAISSPNAESPPASFSEFQHFPSVPKEAVVSPSLVSPKLITTETSDQGLQGSEFGASSLYVQVASVDNGLCENFVDEDDDWNGGNDSDPDYIKSEPDDDDFSEEEDSTASEIDEECKQPRMKINSKKPIDDERGIKSENVVVRTFSKKTKTSKAGTSTTKKRTRDNNRRQRFEESGAMLVQVDPETGGKKFICGFVGCGKSYRNLFSFYDHHMIHNTEGPGKGPGGERDSIQCEECSKSFKQRSHLSYHIRTVHTENLKTKKKQKCDLCSKNILPKDIHKHFRDHIGDEYLMACPNPHCWHVYSNSTSLYTHLNRSGRNSSSSACRESIPNLQDFLEGLKSTTDTCQVCGQKEMNRQSLQSHMDRTHESHTKNFSCPIQGCSRQFTVRQSVILHIHQQHIISRSFDPDNPSTPKEQKCDQCGLKIRPNLMENHLKETHGVGTEAVAVVKCQLCPFVFSAHLHLVNHLLTHTKSILSCHMCGNGNQVKFTKPGKLRSHYLNVHKIKIGKEFKCEECQAVYSSYHRLVQHMNKAHSVGKGDQTDTNERKKSEKMYKCDVCDEACSGLYKLQDHKIEFHGAMPHKCIICGETFLTRALYSKHEREHDEVLGLEKKKEFKCEVEGCGKSFKFNSKLKEHIVSVHNGIRPHVCELCGKSYALANSLKSHTDRVHNDIRPFVCEECGETFSAGTILQHHKLIHTGERPYPCTICNQRFRHKGVLRRHVLAHQRKGADFKPNGPMKQIRKRVEKKR